MGTYYPSGLLQLHLRLEEGVGPLPREALDALRGILAPGQTHRLGIEALGAPVDDRSHITAILPANIDHRRNGHRAADTLSATIAFQDFPVPARMIRALGLVWFAGTVAPWDYQAGLRRVTTSQGGRNTAIIKPGRDTLRFVGFADDVSEDHSSGQVTINCRDYTAIFLDTKVPTDVLKTLDINAPLDIVLRELIRTIPGGAAKGLNMRVDFWVYEDFIPGSLEATPNVADLFPRKARRRRGKAPRLSASYGGQDVSYWDLITDICTRAGMVPMIQEDTLVITPPRNLLGRKGPGSFSRVTSQGEQLTIRRMVHGYNVESLRFARKFGKVSTPGVVVRSWAPGLRAPLLAQWPPPKAGQPKRATHVLPSGRGAEEKFQTLLVRGITDQGQLYRIAQAAYEEMGRAEYGGTLGTRELASFGGDNQDPDLLDMRSGDPLEVVVQQGGRTTGIANYLSQFKPAEAVSRLVTRGFAVDVAQAIVQLNQDTRNLQTVFRTKDVSFKWTLAGETPTVQVETGFGTYMEVRDDTGQAGILDAADAEGSTSQI